MCQAHWCTILLAGGMLLSMTGPGKAAVTTVLVSNLSTKECMHAVYITQWLQYAGSWTCSCSSVLVRVPEFDNIGCHAACLNTLQQLVKPLISVSSFVPTSVLGCNSPTVPSSAILIHTSAISYQHAPMTFAADNVSSDLIYPQSDYRFPTGYSTEVKPCGYPFRNGHIN